MHQISNELIYIKCFHKYIYIYILSEQRDGDIEAVAAS